MLYAKSPGEALVSGGAMGESRSALESCSVGKMSGMPKSLAAAFDGEKGSDVFKLPDGKEGGGSAAPTPAQIKYMQWHPHQKASTGATGQPAVNICTTMSVTAKTRPSCPMAACEVDQTVVTRLKRMK